LINKHEHEKERESRTGFPLALKKVLPFWGAAILAGALAIFLLHKNSVRLINYIEYPEARPGILAETYRTEGEKYYRLANQAFTSLREDPDRSEKMKNLPELKRARRLFLESERLNPAITGIYSFLSDLAAFEGDTASMNYYQGKHALSENQAGAALEAFNLALERDSNFRPALEEKTLTLVNLGRLEEAERSLDRLLSLPDPDARAYYVKALLAARRKREDLYSEALEMALQKDPKHLDSAKSLADFLAGKKEFVRAVEIMEKARQAAPNDANLLHRLGLIYFKSGDLDKAAHILEKALRIEKNSAPLYLDLARVYAKLGKKSHSSAMFQRAVELNPELKDQILFPEHD